MLLRVLKPKINVMTVLKPIWRYCNSNANAMDDAREMEWTLARKLIFGSRKYDEFTPHEKRLADSYQEIYLKEDCILLPNTAAWIEERELSKKYEFFKSKRRSND